MLDEPILEIKERIRKLMEREQLSPSRFADIVGIQRPMVSHILNGRNKPGVNVLSKILQAFPKVSSDWLLVGNGKMYMDDVNDFYVDLFAENPPNAVVGTGDHEYRTETAPKQPQNTTEPPVNQVVEALVAPSKKIAKIVVFYTNGTFEDYFISK